MIAALIILAVILAALFAIGLYVFRSVFDNQLKATENNDPNFLDSDADMMRPTARKLYAYREPLSEAFLELPFNELEITSFDG